MSMILRKVQVYFNSLDIFIMIIFRLQALEKCLRYKLGDEEVYQINEITSCVKVKGRHKKEVTKWLLELGF